MLLIDKEMQDPISIYNHRSLPTATLVMSDAIRILVAQYFQLVDPPHLALPSGNVLIQAAVQEALYELMFDEAITPLPPATYRLRVLKLILARIEESFTDPDKDVCHPYKPIPTALHCHSSNPFSATSLSNLYPLPYNRKY